MRSKSGFVPTFVAETTGVLCAVICCLGWLLGVVDRVSGFWHAGERHDYLLPGEGLLLLVVCGLCVVATVFLVLRGMALLTRRLISRRIALVVSVPSALIGLSIYEILIEHVIPETVILSVDAVFIFVVSGAVVGGLLSAQSQKTCE
jgi:hypothetical protein